MAEEVTERPIEMWSFEETMTALDRVVARIESDELPLEEALALFEQGTLLARHCGELLDHAELRVTELSLEARDTSDSQQT